MPEFLNTFSQGKMNKDADERLIQPGTYRDALNINVSTSEGSDAGVIENVKGNSEIKNKSYSNATQTFTEWSAGYIDSLGNPLVIGSIADPINENIYWFVTTDTADIIAEYNRLTKIVTPILVDTQNILKFSENNLITGINLIEDQLFWTDNKEEPKRINISDWRGSTNDFITHSVMYNRNFIERDVVVIKPAPVTKLNTILKGSSTEGSTTSSTTTDLTDGGTLGNISTSYAKGDAVSILLNGVLNVKKGQVIKLTCSTNSTEGYEPLDYLGDKTVYEFTIKVDSISVDGFTLNGFIQNGPVEIVKGSFPYNIVTVGEDVLFELKMPRFAYRYLYKDNQFSPISAFSEVAFLPGEFDYNAEHGYNKGMANLVKRIILSGFESPLPADVEEIEILYKEDGKNAIYKVDNIKSNELLNSYSNYTIENNSNASVSFNYVDTDSDTKFFSVFPTQKVVITALSGSVTLTPTAQVLVTENVLGIAFDIKKESIYSIITDNQLIRPWDNVPRKAQAQEVVSNRIIYGNYVQNYTVNNELEFDVAETTIDPTNFDYTGTPRASIKSLREYQLGIVYRDAYGRETPVFTDTTGSINVSNEFSDTQNKLKVKILSNSPKAKDGSELFESFKLFVKDASEEYYNVAADKLYESNDGFSAWLSMPSSETNKVTEGDFLVLKKAHNTSEAIKNYPENKFKVLSKKNEAPDELVNKLTIDSSHAYDFYDGSAGTQTTKFPNATPVPGYNRIMLLNADGQSGINDAIFEKWVAGKKVQFTNGDIKTAYYTIESVSIADVSGSRALIITFTDNFTNDVNFLYTSATQDDAPLVNTAVTIQTAEAKENFDKEGFEGRFFIRLEKSDLLLSSFSTDTTLVPDVSTIVTDRYRNGVSTQIIYSGGGGPLQLSNGTEVGSATRLGLSEWNYDGGLKTPHPNDDGQFSSFCDIPFDSCDPWDFVFEVDASSNASAAAKQFEQKFSTGAKIRFSTHDEVYEIKYIHKFTQKQTTTYLRYYIRLDKALKGSISPLQIEVAAARNGNAPIFVDGRQVYDGVSGEVKIGIEILKSSSDVTYSSRNPAIFETERTDEDLLDVYYEISEAIPIAQYNNLYVSDWFNCYTYGNGVESNRIRDDFNAPFIAKGVKANAVLDAPYKEERLTNTLIFSGIYNPVSGLNELNQFIQGEGITKLLDIQSGPVQKLFARETDLLAFCEDKVVRILADKDAIFNADGNAQLTASNRVLGQSMIPSSFGMFGIGKHPESFANYGYRLYFTDAAKGKVLRLSADGVTPISDYGMKRFFQDNLIENKNIIGSYNTYDDTYELTLNTISDKWSDKINSQATTISFKEGVRGWSSRKSYLPENGISLDTFYYTFKDGLIYEHATSDVYNNFYGIQYDSSLTLITNNSPLSVKGFKTLNYTGSEPKVNVYSINQSPYTGI